MTMIANSPVTESYARGMLSPAASPRTYSEARGAPQTPDEASALLSRAERLFRLQGTSAPLLDLTRFLGANSHAWTSANRARLRRLLAGLGADVIGAIVRTLIAHPRTDILDDAELVLRALPEGEAASLRPLAMQQGLPPSVRACLLRAAVHARGPGSEELLLTALVDPEPEIRDAAASLVGELDLPKGRAILHRQLARETSAMVRDSIREALASLAE
jgi:hypothetical protein